MQHRVGPRRLFMYIFFKLLVILLEKKLFVSSFGSCGLLLSCLNVDFLAIKNGPHWALSTCIRHNQKHPEMFSPKNLTSLLLKKETYLAWGCVNNQEIFIFGWPIALRAIHTKYDNCPLIKLLQGIQFFTVNKRWITDHVKFWKSKGCDHEFLQ